MLAQTLTQPSVVPPQFQGIPVSDMANARDRLEGKLRDTYRRKFLLAATVPLILAVSAIAGLVAYQSRTLAEREGGRMH